MKIDVDNINVILATDCGSTTTKAILIQKIDGEYRQTHRGEAPTTVEEPFADVTVGVINSVTEVAELAGRRLVDENEKIIHPATDSEGCDIYISTSISDGTSVSLLEALACKKPVIVSDIPCNREWVTNGVNGFMANVGDYKMFSNYIVKLSKDIALQNSMGEKNYSIALDRADWNKNFNKLEQIYSNLLES